MSPLNQPFAVDPPNRQWRLLFKQRKLIRSRRNATPDEERIEATTARNCRGNKGGKRLDVGDGKKRRRRISRRYLFVNRTPRDLT